MGSSPDQHEQFMLAFVFGSYVHDLDFISKFQWRGRAECDTAGKKREVQGVGEIIIPSHRLLFRVMRIYNNLHVNSLLTCFIFGATSHMRPPFGKEKPG